MFQYYKRSLLQLHRMLHELRANPVSHSQLCLCIQEELLERISYVENRIRQHRVVVKRLQERLHSKTDQLLNKTDARLIRDSISRYRQEIDQYRFLLVTFRSIGDGLAFTYIDKYDIKPLAFKQPSGFISGKKGLRNELRFLRLVFSRGGIGILCDLTSCLRYGDVCVALGKRPYIAEIKSGHAFNARMKRQRDDLNRISSYLYYDKTDRLYGVSGDFQRLEIPSLEVNHIDRLNSILISASKSENKSCLEEVEDGLYYGATYSRDIHMFDPLFKSRSGKLIISMANEWKYTTVGYYPFSLSIRDPNAWYDFCRGELIIIVAVDRELIQRKLLSEGFSLAQDPSPDWYSDSYLHISSVRPNTKFQEFQIGGHFFGRLFSEFLSLDWIIKSIVHRVNYMQSKYS